MELPKVKEYESVIRDLLKITTAGRCDQFHHKKKDLHGWNEPCPIVARWEAVISRAEDLVARNQNDKNLHQIHRNLSVSRRAA